MMNINIAKDCTQLSAEEKITFPEVIQKLSEGDFEGYIANLLSSNKTYFAGSETLDLKMTIHNPSIPPFTFQADKVIQAIRQIQSGQIKYQQFLTEIMQAGCAFYMVFIQGKKAIYYGRNGECHIEHFPSKGS